MAGWTLEGSRSSSRASIDAASGAGRFPEHWIRSVRSDSIAKIEKSPGVGVLVVGRTGNKLHVRYSNGEEVDTKSRKRIPGNGASRYAHPTYSSRRAEVEPVFDHETISSGQNSA